MAPKATALGVYAAERTSAATPTRALAKHRGESWSSRLTQLTRQAQLKRRSMHAPTFDEAHGLVVHAADDARERRYRADGSKR